MNKQLPPLAPPYSYELRVESEQDFYRIRDARDNRVATCYLEENARLVVTALNLLAAPQ